MTDDYDLANGEKKIQKKKTRADLMKDEVIEISS